MDKNKKASPMTQELFLFFLNQDQYIFSKAYTRYLSVSSFPELKVAWISKSWFILHYLIK